MQISSSPTLPLNYAGLMKFNLYLNEYLMQMGYTMTSTMERRACASLWWRLSSNASCACTPPETILYIYLLSSYVNTLFIRNENRSKHILSHILSLPLAYLLYVISFLNMKYEFRDCENKMESSSYTLSRPTVPTHPLKLQSKSVHVYMYRQTDERYL